MAQNFETQENQHMLKLTREERAWLNDYRKAIEVKHPGVVHEMLIYGSKARGQAHTESDLDVLLVITNEAGSLKKRLRRMGYLLAATSNVLPSILAYTQEEWESRRRNRSSFRQAVERDAVRVV
jgi:predicted nucleotidyltransferase